MVNQGDDKLDRYLDSFFQVIIITSIININKSVFIII